MKIADAAVLVRDGKVLISDAAFAETMTGPPANPQVEGLATYRGHVGENAMAITCELQDPLPRDLSASFAAAVA